MSFYENVEFITCSNRRLGNLSPPGDNVCSKLGVLVVTLAHSNRGRVGIVATYRGAMVLGVLVVTLAHTNRDRVGIVGTYRGVMVLEVLVTTLSSTLVDMCSVWL